MKKNQHSFILFDLIFSLYSLMNESNTATLIISKSLLLRFMQINEKQINRNMANIWNVKTVFSQYNATMGANKQKQSNKRT